MKKGILITLAVIVGLAVLVGLFFSGTYNKLVSADEAVKSAWAQVENVYQRRLDLIPNLVETVKGYASHESDTLMAVTEARASISKVNLTSDVVNNPEMMQKFQESQSSLSSALSRLLVVSENYPDLKANQNFLDLQSQLEGTENRIAVERKRFNEVAQAFNTLRRSFPNVIVAGFMGLHAKAYFESDKGAEKAPQVKF